MTESNQKYLCSSIVIKYNFEVLLFYLLEYIYFITLVTWNFADCMLHESKISTFLMELIYWQPKKIIHQIWDTSRLSLLANKYFNMITLFLLKYDFWVPCFSFYNTDLFSGLKIFVNNIKYNGYEILKILMPWGWVSWLQLFQKNRSWAPTSNLVVWVAFNWGWNTLPLASSKGQTPRTLGPKFPIMQLNISSIRASLHFKLNAPSLSFQSKICSHRIISE